MQSKKLEGFINEEITEPKDKLSSEWKNWNATNALVVTWLFNSMTQQLLVLLTLLLLPQKYGRLLQACI